MGMFRIDREIISAWLESSSIAGIAALGLAVQILLTVVAIAAALLAVRVLSVGVALVTLFDFTLTRHDGDLRARYGLFTRIALTLRTPRIQAVQQTQTLLHRWLKRVSLSVDLTGDRGGPEQQQNAQSKTRWLAPVCRPEQAPDLIKAALPMVDLTAGRDWQPLANGARGRIFRRTLLLWTLISAYPAVWYFREAAFLVAVAGAPFAWVHAHLYVKHTCWALAPDVLLFQRGWPTRRLTIAPRDRVQSVSMSTSPFDRRRHMASVFVDTAGGTLRGELNIRYLDSSTARRLVKELYRLG
jgi:putative membrane protein